MLKELIVSQLIVWNVGQGQWTTVVTPTVCHHIDMGGERNPVKLVTQLCEDKDNLLSFSHWDWDHVSFAYSFIQSLLTRQRKVCLLHPPKGKAKSKLNTLLDEIPACDKMPSQLKEISFTETGTSNNERSRVFWTQQSQVLIPGDSPAQAEKMWSPSLPTNLRGLILGHHGSKTSTSKKLLRYLPTLKWAVASARKQKYGHPHSLVVRRLKNLKIPLLRTEDWGHLHFTFQSQPIASSKKNGAF